MELGQGKVALPSLRPVQARASTSYSTGSAAPTRGQRGRIDLLDEDMHVARGQLGRDVAGRRGQAHHFQLRVEQGQGDGKGAVDAGDRKSPPLSAA